MTLAFIAPLLFGVPHVVNDFIFLFQRPKIEPRSRLVIYAFLLSIIGLPLFTNLQITFLFGMMGPLLALVLISFEKGHSPRLWLAITIYTLFFNLIWLNVAWSMNSFVLIHNFTAFIAWYWIKPHDRKIISIALSATFFFCFLIFYTLPDCLATLTIFLQMVHYLIWLKFIPAGSNRSARNSLFLKISWMVSAGLITYVLFNFSSGPGLSSLYLQIFQFHGFMEFLILTYVWGAQVSKEVVCSG
jgi:hypothetical protein